MKKRCPDCERWLPLEAFGKHKSTKDGLRCYCKECNRKRTYDTRCRKTYGISHEQAVAMRKRPCDICGSTHNIHVDHDHKTGKVRGSLCVECNTLLGHYEKLLSIGTEKFEKYLGGTL